MKSISSIIIHLVLAAPSPPAPRDCNVATSPPATVGAIHDIIDAALDPGAIPPLLKQHSKYHNKCSNN